MTGVYMKWRNSVFLKIKMSSHMFSKLQWLVFTHRNTIPTHPPKRYKITAHRGIPANYI